jgi:hypothetical protein
MAKPFDLAVGEWWRVPQAAGTRLADVFPSVFAGGSSNPPVAITENWGSGCVDALRRDFIIWGGGHNAYAGNEVYALDIESFQWRRKSMYSTATQDADANADGSSNIGHTYDTLEYDPFRDHIHVSPGRGLWGGDAVVSAGTWWFDPANETPNAAAPSAWHHLDNAPDIDPDVADPRPISAYNPVDRKIYVWHRRGFARCNPDASAGTQYEVLTTFDPSPDFPFNVQMVFIPAIGGSPARMLTVGGDGATSRSASLRNLDDFSFVNSNNNDMGATGATSVEAVNGPGLDYDANGGLAIAWVGLITGGTDRRDTYTLNTQTKVWTRNAGTGDVPPEPRSGNISGTYGRFRYLGDLGATYAGLFILVNATNDDVFFFRASAPPPGTSLPAGPFAQRLPTPAMLHF